MSDWTVRDLEWAGVLQRVRVPIPGGRELRKLLFDRHDLDRLIETWKRGRLTVAIDGSWPSARPAPTVPQLRMEWAPMGEFHEIWIEQCEAARDIREAFGLQEGLGCLVGEKLLNFLRAADEDPAFAGDLPRFVAGIKQIFDRGTSLPS